MREATKITVKYQFVKMLIMQAAASGVAFVFGSVAFWYFTNINIMKQLLSLVFMCVNFAFLYTTAKKFAVSDGKPYTPLKPSVFKAVMFGVVISAVNLIFMLIFVFLWRGFGDETGIHGIFPTIYNAFFYLWSLPYNGIMNLTHGSFTIYSAIAMLLLPIAAATAGYIAGKRKFEFTDKLDALMYEKDD